MNDAQYLQWIQENLTALNQWVSEIYTISYIGKYGQTIEVSGASLKQCIDRAIESEKLNVL
jgi:hypothetical protein